MTLTWTQPDTSCPITQYFVSYSGSVLWEDERTDDGSETVAGDLNETEVTGLTPYTNYTFCVLANNEKGNGPEVFKNIHTLESSE